LQASPPSLLGGSAVHFALRAAMNSSKTPSLSLNRFAGAPIQFAPAARAAISFGSLRLMGSSPYLPSSFLMSPRSFLASRNVSPDRAAGAPAAPVVLLPRVAEAEVVAEEVAEDVGGDVVAAEADP
jgi:hypothetical protein